MILYFVLDLLETVILPEITASKYGARITLTWYLRNNSLILNIFYGPWHSGGYLERIVCTSIIDGTPFYEIKKTKYGRRNYPDFPRSGYHDSIKEQRDNPIKLIEFLSEDIVSKIKKNFCK